MQNKDRSSEEYAAAILCGGKSIRMGQDKATMLLGGVRLADRLIREFAPCGEVLLSVRDDTQAEQIRCGFRGTGTDLPGVGCRKNSGLSGMRSETEVRWPGLPLL